MPSDIGFLKFEEDEPGRDDPDIYAQYLALVASGHMRRYKRIVHERGSKQGQSYYGHVIDLTSIAARLGPVIEVNATEMRCVLLALTIHDMNKIPPHNKRPDGKEAKYADAATPEQIRNELEQLVVDTFFQQWRDYLLDIVVLAHFHQEAATGTTLVIDQRKINECKLPRERIKGPLKSLMKAADKADNSHSGDYADHHEMHLRDVVLHHINTAMPERQYRFMGHRLAELRGLFTNVIHNELVKYFRETYSEPACIDLLYYPEGVHYLLDKTIPLVWDDQALQEIAVRIHQRLAEMKFDALVQFIKPRPAGIVVDATAIDSGATVEQIFEVISSIVSRKLYKSDWLAERNKNARDDLEKALSKPGIDATLKEHIRNLVDQQTALIPFNEMALKRGEFASAYRKFLEDHQTEQLKAVREDAWARVYRLFKLPEASYPLYNVIDPYRRAYFFAADLPVCEVDEMERTALADLAVLEQQASAALATKKGKAAKKAAPGNDLEEGQISIAALDSAYLVDYLRRNLEVWDSLPHTRPVGKLDFQASLRLYANPKQQHKQCCHCGSPLPAEEWMAGQVPGNIGVQSFSNRLEGGSKYEPKRNVCDTCRMQFILEKVAWRSHGDKQGAKQSTFYLHLFPYAFFTKTQLHAWWRSIDHLRDSDHTAFLVDTRTYFREFEKGTDTGNIQGYRTGINGLGLPAFSETVSNTPVLPIIAPGENYGLQFLLALEKAVVLSRWFECRLMLSRSPVPSLNLAHQFIDEKPVVLMVEGMPRNLSWLLPSTSFDPAGVTRLCETLGHLHHIADTLYYQGSDTDTIIHDLAAAAADDPLALYYELDRLMEQKLAHEKVSRAQATTPEQQAISLSRQLAPVLHTLVGQS
ncbi:MAG: type I-D CRISPR-associated protein Cas10d/Csc3 [Chloroflexota bacterium]|nr:type I-D CRISPR-associated protein Cas10d/Csc3 [Chloroflexota bacterium]